MPTVFTRGRPAVMTGFTGSTDTFMGEVRDGPVANTMAGVTLRTGCNMVTMFTRCRSTVMAGPTGLCYAVMRKVRNSPVICRMAGVTLFGR